MADWDHIECGFNALDETINFGARSFTQLDNLYETSTLASIKNTTENSYTEPNIKGVIQNGSVFFAINKTIRVFKDLRCSDLSFSATFDDEIDVFCVTSEAKYLLLCCRNGAVSCVDVFNARVVCGEIIHQNEVTGQPLFINAFVENHQPLCFLALMQNGRIYRIEIHDTCSEGLENEFRSQILVDLHHDLYIAAFLNPYLFINGSEFSVFNVQTKEIATDDNIGPLKRIYAINTRMLVGLDENGYLIHICTNSFVFREYCDILYEDIVLINGSHLLGVTQKSENGESHIKLLSFPDLCETFSLKTKEQICFMVPEHIDDDIMYISKLKEDGNVMELRFQVVSETSPENRLKKLLRRQKFDEAEEFAKLFDLDLVEIQKARAQTIVDKTICDDSDINNLIYILNIIEDYTFKIQCCLNIHADCSTLVSVEKILKYGYLLSVPNSNKVVSEEILNLQNLIINLMFRFNTFMMLVQCGSTKNGVQDWVEFSTCNLIEEVNIALQRRSMEESIIIYSRFDNLTVSNLDEEDITSVLNVLNIIPVEQQIPFLNTFIPLTLSYFPSALPVLIQWILQMVFSLEMECSNKFPEIAIDFLSKMVRLLKVQWFTNVSFHQKPIIDQESLKDLENIRKSLEKLQALKTDYRMMIPLQKFLQGTEALVETLFNTALCSAGSEYFLEDFIQKFILDTQLNPDDLFNDVIKDIIKYEEEFWIKFVPAILNCINSLNIKIETTIIVLKTAKMPWCKAIREVASVCLQYSHPLVDKIIQLIQWEPKCVILQKEPYKLVKQYINTIDYLKFAVRRMMYCNEPTMVADIYGICKDFKEKHEADMLLINHYIHIGDSENALTILNNNSPDEIIKCCKKIVIFATFCINKEYKSKSLSDNYFDIIRRIFIRLQQNNTEIEIQCLEENCEYLMTLYRIHKNFDVEISFKHLADRSCKNYVLQSLISEAILKFQETQQLLDFIRNCEKISTYLKIDKNTVLLESCKQIGNFSTLLTVAEKMDISEPNSETLCYIVTLLLQHLGSPNTIIESNSEPNEHLILKNIDIIDINVFLKGLKLARKIIVHAILNCDSSILRTCLELGKWVEATYYLTQSKKTFLATSYSSDIMMPSFSVLNSVKDMFHLYIRQIDESRSPDTKYLTYFIPNVPKLNKEQLEMEIRSLHSTITCLCTEGHALTAYKLLVILQMGLIHSSDISKDAFQNLNEIIDLAKKQLILNVFAAKQVDQELAYDLLLSCDVISTKRLLFQMLKHYKRDILKFEAVASVCLRFLLYNNIEDGQFLCKNVINRSKWWKELKCHIPYEEFFKKSPEQLIEKLIKLNDLDLMSLKGICSDFNLDAQKYFQLYLKNLLINWKPDHEFQVDQFGKEQLIVKNNEDHLFLDCMEVMEDINNKEYILTMMDNIWEKLNFYHYEVFLCMLNIHQELKSTVNNDQKNLFLIFLKNYTRVSKPGQAEREQWYTLYPDTQVVDLLSEWRLPFTPTLFSNKIWSIIRPEINLKTYTKWFEAISILTKFLNKDDICSYAIKHIMSSGVFQTKISEDWVLHPKHKDLLEEIDMCIQQMSNFEQATSAIYSLITNIPGGADRVNASKLCYKYAIKYQEQHPQSEDVQKAVIKVQKKYFTYATIHILYKNELADKEYLERVSRPVDELIEALYMDDRIIKKAYFVTMHCPSINKAVDELAILHHLNIQEKRNTLLNQWLMSDTAITDFNLEAKVFAIPGNKNKTSNNSTSENLIRASYLCTSGDISKWRLLLLNSVKLETTEATNLNYKAMALKCFCNITDIDMVEELTETPYEEFRIYINKLMLISSLERFGFSLTIESLDNYNKNELLNCLSYHVTGPFGAKTMALVCITYTIYECKFWTLIITAMLKFSMIEELKECVTFLKTSTAIQNNKYYIEAWETIIQKSFDVAPNENENYIRSICIENFYFIQACPVLSDINLEYVVKQCTKLKQYDFAVFAVQYLIKEQQQFYIKVFLTVNMSNYKDFSVDYLHSVQ